MAVPPFWALIIGILAVSRPLHGHPAASPYLSAATLFQNYEKMISSFKIYIYPIEDSAASLSSSPQPLSLFHSSLTNSQFITPDPEQADLFYIPFPPEISTRSRARVVKEIRTNYPFWNRTLGADNFFAAPAGIEYSSDRNAVELKKNAIQISIFPTTSGNFIPHKDITLPPLNASPLALIDGPGASTASYLGLMIAHRPSSLVKEMKGDDEFRVVSESSDQVDLMKDSKFCLMEYDGDVTWLAEAMAVGCVPVVIVDRPIQDIPLMDVLKWSDLALLVAPRGGAKRLKEVLKGVGAERYERMRESGVTASRHLVWNLEPQPHDAFHMLMYQLWLRRHTVRYARRESE